MKKNKLHVTLALGLLVIFLGTMLTGCFFSLPLGKDSREPEQESQDAEYMEKLEELIALLDEKYIDGYDKEHLGDYLAEAAVAATGDRWSYYISAEDMAEYAEDKHNSYVGIGVIVRLMDEEEGGILINQVTTGSPAYNAGIQPGDQIVGIEDVNAEKMDLKEAKELIRGEEGTQVRVTIRRDGVDTEYTITRAVIESEVVISQMLPQEVGYIKILNFNEHSAQRTIEAIETLMGQGAKGLVFDLRFNPGGYKKELIEVLDYILPEGPLFRSVDYKGLESVDYSDENCIHIPMSVLVNQDSYSAAEFFAAALQEYDAAQVVGTQTVGKANFQSTFVLSDGSAVALSVGHYQTPNGVTLANVGITPDRVVEVDEDTYMKIYFNKLKPEEDLQLQEAISVLSAGNT